YDAELLRLTNLERQKAGVSALTLSSKLGKAAQNHAKDMANNNYFSHTGLNGSSPSERIKATGYKYSAVAENIAAGHSTAEDTIQGWMKSTGHRKNMLNRTYTEIGFGYAYSDKSKYRHYWVQVFGKSQGKGSSTPSTPTPPQPTPTKITLKTKSNAIFDRLEKDYAEFFSPTSATQVIGSGKEIIYYRLYNNPYQTALATTFPDDFWIAINQEWDHFGTLEEANQYLCNNQCWKNK
ncbi:MAG TPA: hypothetical protein DCM38_03665, partial [Gammaproteobacteria bacterium]|nr:hypothetical protein [Gammaproteobacteria bacterium]